jgi:hypothetical protein
LAHCRMQYDRYVIKCHAEGRTPMKFTHCRSGYIRWWKCQQKSLYVQYDVLRSMREYELSGRVTEMSQFC